ncbi:hypothetical protein [Bradyrhizobium sp. SZCCHNR1020]|uniref:hypothetical protein n=1 Tax=Bradyrhizobium sp. SZCCHNR1020 TaxID=3057343 RepID=UPI002915E8D2|nr:hypothetical protein [Bradyrhizobium sp. SZCCHNR1020]
MTTRRGFLGAMLGAPIAVAAAKEAAHDAHVFPFRKFEGLSDWFVGESVTGEAILTPAQYSRLTDWVEIGNDDGGFIVPKQLSPLMRSLLDGEIAFIDGRGAYKRGVGDHTPELLAPWELEA